MTLRIPDEAPAFEPGFQIEQEMFGKNFVPDDLRRENIGKRSLKEKERRLCELADDNEWKKLRAYEPIGAES